MMKQKVALENISDGEIELSGLKARYLCAWGALELAIMNAAEAETRLLEAHSLAPDYMNAAYHLGRAHILQMKFGEGIEVLNRAISIYKQYRKVGGRRASLYWVYVSLGLAHLGKGDDIDARNHFILAGRYCEMDLGRQAGGKHIQLQSALAIALLGQERYEEAEKAMREFVANPSTRIARGVVAGVRDDLNILLSKHQSDNLRRILEILNKA